jgi:hypothetical protein
VRKLTQRAERLRCFSTGALPTDFVSGRIAVSLALGWNYRPFDCVTIEAAPYCGAGGCIPAGMPRGGLFAATRSSDKLVRSVAMAWSGLAGINCSRASESYT